MAHLCPFCLAPCKCFDVDNGAPLDECLHDCDPMDDEGESFTAADITDCDDNVPVAQSWGADQQDDPDTDEEC